MSGELNGILGQAKDTIVNPIATAVSIFATPYGRKCFLGLAVALLAISVLAGTLTPHVGTIGGLALGGFNILLLVPIAIATVVTTALLGGGIAYLISYTKNTNKPTAFMKGTVVGGVLGIVLSIFVLLAASRSICQNFSRFSFTYGDTLAFAGHSLWITVAIGLAAAGICRAKIERMFAPQPPTVSAHVVGAGEAAGAASSPSEEGEGDAEGDMP